MLTREIRLQIIGLTIVSAVGVLASVLTTHGLRGQMLIRDLRQLEATFQSGADLCGEAGIRCLDSVAAPKRGAVRTQWSQAWWQKKGAQDIAVATVGNAAGDVRHVSLDRLTTLSESATGAIVAITTICLAGMFVFWLLAVVLPARAMAGRLQIELRRVLVEGKASAVPKDPLVVALADTLGELEAARRRLLASERIATMGFFAGGIAHQIGNPLSAARQYVEALSAQIRVGQSVSESTLERIRQQLERIHRAIEGLSRLARPDRLQFESIELAGMLNDVLDHIRQTWRGEFDVRVRGDSSLMVSSDRLALEQAIINFIRNGIEAQSGGAVRIEIVLNSVDEAAEMVIRDFGRGFPPGFYADALLESEKLGGTGLGIPLAVRLLELLGARANFSNWENGAEVRIVFPRGK